jgi:phosphonate transport system substrate-binding protein
MNNKRPQNSKRVKPLFWGIVCALLVLPVTSFSQLGNTDTDFVLGIFPRKGFTQALQNFTPLAEYLGRQLKRKVVLKSGRNFSEFWQGVVQRDYDLVHYNQYHYVRSHKEFAYDVIARNEENHESTISGALIVRKDSGIKQLTDLRGKRIIFGGGPRAMQSYIIATYLLQQAGLPDSAYETAFAESPTNAIYATYLQQAAAAGSADSNLHLPMVKNRIDTSQLKVLARGEKLAHLPWAVKRELPEALKQRITQLLISLNTTPEGREILHSADLTAIRETSDEDYDPHRKIIKQILGESY